MRGRPKGSKDIKPRVRRTKEQIQNGVAVATAPAAVVAPTPQN